MKRATGFTLIELLVVIAIIGILAAIVVPQVTKYINRAHMTKAVSEVKGIEVSLTKMLSDAGRSDFSQMFDLSTLNLLRADRVYANTTLYELLRLGRNANTGLLPPVRNKLGDMYMDAPLDPWDNRYQFYPGPWTEPRPIQFRSYRAGVGDRLDPSYVPYQYNPQAKGGEDARIPGNPPVDNLYGFPAPRELPFYVWSWGANLEDDQQWSTGSIDKSVYGGGDDLNNWDNEGGWQTFYS